MASGGKHLKKQANKKRGSGAHLSERDRQRAARRRSRSANRRGRLRRGAPQMIVMLLLCIVMISPLRSCIISDSDYVAMPPRAKRPLPTPESLRKRQTTFPPR